MTKAIRIHAVGGPDVMKMEDIVLPAPGVGEVLVQNHAIGVNYIDVYFRTGAYAAPQLPFTPGNEGAGVVTAVGPGVTEFKVGDRVAYAATLGSYAQERIIDPKFLVHLPKSISFETGAAMMLKGLTAQYLLRRTYKVEEGDTILVHAAAGGVGLIVCQWAKALGANIIATVGSDEKGKLASEAGAHHIINYTTENFAERVREITKGKLCHVVYDGVGKSTFPASLDCLRPFGMFVSFGSASGAIDNFNLALLSQKGSLFATRPTLFTHMARRKDLNAMAKDLFKVVEKGLVQIPVHATMPLADAAKAHSALEARKTTGATVLIP